MQSAVVGLVAGRAIPAVKVYNFALRGPDEKGRRVMDLAEPEELNELVREGSTVVR